MRPRNLHATILGFAALLLVPSTIWAQTAGNAATFAIVGGAGVSANGATSTVNGNVGIDPAAATFITGFPARATITPPFLNHGNDLFAIAAAASVQTLYDSAAMAPAGGIVTPADLTTGGDGAGNYLPGKYSVPVGVAIIPTSITLTTPGLYIFTVNTGLTTAVVSNVILGPGVDPCNVWWRVPTTASIGGGFAGTVVSNALIALGTNVTMTGRALTTDAGSVTLAGNDTIGGCSGGGSGGPSFCTDIAQSPSTLPNLVVGVLFTTTFTSSGGIGPYTYSYTGTLPAGMFFNALGEMTGTPTRAESQTITITTTDAAGCFSSAVYPIVVLSSVPTLPQIFIVLLVVGLAAIGSFRLRRRTSVTVLE
ncbi:MAG: ice-binding family protein [Vicinamibacterales bacterium]